MDLDEESRRGGWLMMAVGWGLALLMAVVFFSGVLQGRENPNRLSVVAGMTEELILEKNSRGHYLVEGTMNGAVVTFLVDTGATRIAMSEETAARAGLVREGRVVVQTAAGAAAAWGTTIDELQVGFLVFGDLRGVIVEDYGDDTVLLGMNALGRLDIRQNGGRLVLRVPSQP